MPEFSQPSNVAKRGNQVKKQKKALQLQGNPFSPISSTATKDPDLVGGLSQGGNGF